MLQKFKTEYFTKDSIFLDIDERKNRQHIPTDYYSTNMRANWFFNETQDFIKNKTVLDLGCYTGLYSYCCLKIGAKKIHGIDITEKQIKNALNIFGNMKEYHGKYSFEFGDILEKIKTLPDNSYDTTLLIGVLYFFPDYFELLREIKRITRENVFIDTMSAAYIPLIYNTYDYDDYLKMLNEPFCYYRNRDDQDFTKWGFNIKKFGGEQSMTYHSHNNLKMVLQVLGYKNISFLEFDSHFSPSIKEYSPTEQFHIKHSQKLKLLFEKIKRDHNEGIFPYFLNTRYLTVAKK